MSSDSTIVTVLIFVVSCVVSAIVAYFTAQMSMTSRVVRLETSLEQSITTLTRTIASAHKDFIEGLHEVRDELRTYYQRRL